jgi:hypothetical protein
MSLLANQSGVRPGEYFWSSAVDIGKDGFEYIGGVQGVAGSSIGVPMTVASIGFTPVKKGIIVVFASADVSATPGVAPANMSGVIYLQVGSFPIAGATTSIPTNEPKNIAVSGGSAVEAGVSYTIEFILDSASAGAYARGNLACFFFE